MQNINIDVNIDVEKDAQSPINRTSLRTLKDEKELVGVEIGTDTGKNAENILQNLDIKTLYLIDPYVAYGDGICKTTAAQITEYEKEAKKRLEPYKDKIVWLKDTSENAIDMIPDNIDFVYIDGNHSSVSVKKDIELYEPKVKDGGLVAGHDYGFPQVQNAVRDSLHTVLAGKNNDCGPHAIDWWKVKHGGEYEEIV